MDDERLCQNGGVQFGTIGYYNWFGTYMSRSQGEQIATHIKSNREKQNLIVQIQDWKGQYETAKVQLNKPSPPFYMLE